MEQYLLKSIQKSKTNIKKNATTTFYNKSEQLYLETHISGVSLRPSFLQVRNGMPFPRNEAPDNAALWPVVLWAYATPCGLGWLLVHWAYGGGQRQRQFRL